MASKEEVFSTRLERWLKNSKPKTIAELNAVFEEKSFAVVILLLMAIPALPLPTGGISHATEIVSMLLSLELIAGRRTIWLPKRWQTMKLESISSSKSMAMLLGRIRWLERFSRPRFAYLLENRFFLRVVGLGLFAFTLVAFLAPPFSGLDTLPALGVVLMSLSLLLGDGMYLIFGLISGLAGATLVIIGGGLVLHFINSLF